MKNKNKGFSLVELLIALTVSGIVLTALLVLITQSVQGYTKQTAISQLLNEAELTLNQISVEIMESDAIYISSNTDGEYGIYTDNVIDLSAGDPSKYKYPCGYILEDDILYYIDDLGGKSEVTDHVTGFKVYLDKDSFELDSDGGIDKIDKDTRIIVEITMKKFNYERTVRRTIRARNDISEVIWVDALSTAKKEVDGALVEYIVSTKTQLKKGINISAISEYVR